MSNVFVFPTPNLSGWPERCMSDNERDLLIRTIQLAAPEQNYPLNHVLPKIADSIRDYPMEDVILKSLDPCGYLMSFNYPTYHLHWMFRAGGMPATFEGKSLEDHVIQDRLEKGAWSMGIPTKGVRFFYRFLRDLHRHVHCDSIVYDDRSIVVTGMLEVSPFQCGFKSPQKQFTAILTRQ